MKNKLTEQQIYNEALTKFFTRLLKKRMGGGTVDDMIKKSPSLKKSVDNLNKGIEEFDKAFRKKHGDKFADRVQQQMSSLVK